MLAIATVIYLAVAGILGLEVLAAQMPACAVALFRLLLAQL